MFISLSASPFPYFWMKTGCSVYRKNTCLVYLAVSCSEDVTDPWLCIVKLTSSAPTGIMDRRQPVVVKDLLLPLVTPSDAERHRVQTCTGSQSARSWTRCGVNAQCSCFSCGRRLSGCLSNLVSSLATDEFCDLSCLTSPSQRKFPLLYDGSVLVC